MSSPQMGFPRGFSGWHHFLFGPLRPKCPTSDLSYLRPILRPPVIIPYTRATLAPCMWFCLHSVTDGDTVWVFSWVRTFRVSSCRLHRRVSPQGFTGLHHFLFGMPRPRRSTRPLPIVIRPTHRCTVYVARAPCPPCAFVYIQ